MIVQKSDVYRRFEESLYVQLDGAAGGEPVEIAPICDYQLKARFEVAIWARADIVRTTVPGNNPIGPVVEDEAEARAALADAGAEAAKHPALASRLKARLESGDGPVFSETQGFWREAPMPQTRSVVRKCAACAGAGSFACDACEAQGDRLCERCDGAGVVDQVCASCRGRARAAGGRWRPQWDESILSFRLRRTEKDADPDCENCHGAGALTVTCAACDGAKRVPCALCAGTGRVECADCGGAGAQTDRYSPTLLFQYTIFTDVEPSVSPVALAKFRVGAQRLTKLGLLKPRFFDFKSDGLGYRATYLADAALVGARASIGRRSPRVAAEIYGVGDGPTLVDPPPLIDALHQRALDRLRMSGVDGPRRLADALADRDLGRAALRAAARREFNFDASEYEPLATQTYAQRLFELSKVCHRYAGWRSRRWYWPVAALTAPLLIGALDASGATSAFAGWTSLAAASNGASAEAARKVAEGGAIAARIATLVLWWLAALGGAALLYRLSIKRLLGVGREASRWDVVRAGPAPVLGMIAGALMTALTLPTPEPSAQMLAEAGQVAETVEAQRREAREEARARAQAEARGPTAWRLIQGPRGGPVARASALGPQPASLSIQCDEGRPILRYVEYAPYLGRGARLSIGLSTNRSSLGLSAIRIRDEGVAEMIISARVMSALRNGAWLRVEFLEGPMRWPVREFDLEGSAAAIDQATSACPP